MTQQNPRPSTLDDLGLTTWAQPGRTAAGLGSLDAVLGDFAPVPALPLFVMPAQRAATVFEALR